MTSAERARCVEIARALDSGDQRAWLEAEGRMSPVEKSLIWDMRADQVARGRKKTLIPNDIKVFSRDRDKTELRSHDLDYWADDLEPDDDQDDDDDDLMPCPACNGRGRDAAGNPCAACRGTGKVPDDFEDPDEEARSFYGEFEDEG
jgi:hypothetical protein